LRAQALFGGGNKEVGVLAGQSGVHLLTAGLGRPLLLHACAHSPLRCCCNTAITSQSCDNLITQQRGVSVHASVAAQGGGGGMPNPFDMGKLMESVKKAQQMVQVETQRVQAELEA
jgi:hypothetical protein